MEGIRNRRNSVREFFFAFVCIPTLFASISVTAETSPKIDTLRQNRKLVLELLKRVDEGKDPCYSKECQTEKLQIGSYLYRIGNRIPLSGVQFLSSREEGIQTLARIARSPFIHPDRSQIFPRTLKEWITWWKLRYSYESEAKATWMKFYSEIVALYDGFQLYTKIANGPVDQQELVEEAWTRGLEKAARALLDSTQKMDLAEQAQRVGDKTLSDKLKKDALDAVARFKEIEKDFGGDIRGVVEAIFPNASFTQVISFISLVSELKQTRSEPISLFDRSFKDEIEVRIQDVRNLNRAAQRFNDLEYGVVGINNFYSPVNPQVAIEREIPIQEFLNQVDEKARILSDMAAFYFLMKAGRDFFGSYVGTALLPSAAQYLSAKNDFQISSQLWAPSDRVVELQQNLPRIEEEMERRRLELFRTHKLLKTKLADLDQEIEQAEVEQAQRGELP